MAHSLPKKLFLQIQYLNCAKRIFCFSNIWILAPKILFVLLFKYQIFGEKITTFPLFKYLNFSAQSVQNVPCYFWRENPNTVLSRMKIYVARFTRNNVWKIKPVFLKSFRSLTQKFSFIMSHQCLNYIGEKSAKLGHLPFYTIHKHLVYLHYII